MNAKKVVSFAVGPIGGAALGFITLPVVTWFYSAEDIGRIAMLQVVSSFCVLLFSLGLDQAYVRDYHESVDKPALLKAALLPGLLLLVVGLAFCFIVPDFISQALFSVDSVLISVLVALCFGATFVSRFLSLILRMQEKGLAFSMSQVLPKLLFLSVIGFYILFSFGFDFLYLIIAQTLSVVAVTLVYGWNTRQEWLAALSRKIDREKLKPMLRFGAPLIMGGVAFWGLTAMDKLFLRSLSTFEELGIYSVASSFAAVAVILQSIFSTVWAPTVYKWAAEGINTEHIDQITEYVLVAVVILFSLAGIFSWVVTYLLPPSYASVQYVLVPCMAYPLFYTLSEATGVGLGIARKSAYTMIASILAVVINYIGNYWLIPIFGAAGAAIATASAFWVFLVVRTEFAIIVWRRMPRLKLYCLTLTCLVVSIFFVFLGREHYSLFVLLWCGGLCVSLLSLFLKRGVKV
ncbi:oligosaccharide flippase family protein [Pseudomonas sp. G34]|uniref:lipopolysaccharide biosynthesis protein n=1 Tax=Pseudomonas sp. G34 TaxID=3059083 RepID=UPI002808A089|nr:oligosaccharide flippase family protein [Pseudomonas sp. G34]MDQ7985754.1 oligosaccharide flippase family protein [Pseudomonas sp. G34]